MVYKRTILGSKNKQKKYFTNVATFVGVPASNNRTLKQNHMKIAKTSLLILMICSCISAMAQTSKSINVSGFNSISVNSGIDLYLTQANAETLIIKADEELIKNVIVEQSGNHITIKYKSGINWGRMFSNKSIKVYVSYKNLIALSANGGSDVYSQNTLKTDKLNINANGGSDVKLTLVCKDLNISCNGGSDIDLKGSGENMQLSANGGSDVNAFGYIVNNAKVSVNGGSDANIYVNKALEAGANGGSDVNYKGNAVLRKTSSSKSGDVNHVK